MLLWWDQLSISIHSKRNRYLPLKCDYRSSVVATGACRRSLGLRSLSCYRQRQILLHKSLVDNLYVSASCQSYPIEICCSLTEVNWLSAITVFSLYTWGSFGTVLHPILEPFRLNTAEEALQTSFPRFPAACMELFWSELNQIIRDFIWFPSATNIQHDDHSKSILVHHFASTRLFNGLWLWLEVSG